MKTEAVVTNVEALLTNVEVVVTNVKAVVTIQEENIVLGDRLLDNESGLALFSSFNFLSGKSHIYIVETAIYRVCYY